MRKRRLKKWVKVVLGLSFLMLLITTLAKIYVEDESIINKCMIHHSKAYCYKLVLG